MAHKKEIISGIYRHFKGNEYEVMAIAKDSESLKKNVIYRSLKDNKIWSRPLEMFSETAEQDGKNVSRFTYISESSKDDFEDKYKRALAELQNTLRSSAREKIEAIRYANEELFKEILPVYDNLKLSISSLADDLKKNPWVEGVGYVIKQFEKIFEENSVVIVEAVGKKFDPSIMESVGGEGEMVDTIERNGYMYKDKLLRAVQVKLKN